MPQRTQGARRARGAQATRGKGRNAAPAFSSKSFAGGAICGALAVLAVLYGAPMLLSDAATAEPGASAAGPRERPTFTFWDVLPQSEVRTGVEPFQHPDATPEPAPDLLLLQAAAFRGRNEADTMRARLLLEGMNAGVEIMTDQSGVLWHRVMVGPFTDEAEMQTVLTRLRAMDVSPAPVRRPRSG